MPLADELMKKGVLKNPALIKAFEKADRKYFVPEADSKFAYADEPLPIGEGQTISQPWTVAFMLELLRPKAGENIMEIGYGSGWVSALLACTRANVYAMELLENICKFGRENFEKFKKEILEPGSLGKAEFFCRDGTSGLPEEAKKLGGFDKIIASAAAQKDVPVSWKEQLKIGGCIVAPVKDSLLYIMKESESEFIEKEFHGFLFVPLRSGGQ